MVNHLGTIKLKRDRKDIVDWQELIKLINRTSLLPKTAKDLLCICIKKRLDDETRVYLSKEEVENIYGSSLDNNSYKQILKDSTDILVKLAFVFKKDGAFNVIQLINNFDYSNNEYILEFGKRFSRLYLNDFIDYDEVSIELSTI